MKSAPALLLATLCLSAHLHAEEPVPVPAPLASHAESAESKPHAESAEAAEPGSPAGGAAERSEAEGVSHAEPAERAEPAAPGGDAIQHSAFSTQHSPLSATVSLTDGSSLKGSLRHRFLPAESAILGRLRIDLSSVESIVFEPDPAAAARVAFRNGDLVSAVLAPKHDHLVLDTLVGPLAIPLRAVASLAIASDATDALIYHCTFDSPSSITRPAVGPAGTFLGGDFVPGKVGNALRVRKGLSSAIVHFEKGTIQPRGTIEFWAKIENDRETFADGGDPRFFMLVTEPCAETLLQFASNDGCGRGGLAVYHQMLNAASEDQCLSRPRYESILVGAPKDWHHYALAWDGDGVAGASAPDLLAVFVDGRRIPLHGDLGLGHAPRIAARFRDNPATLFFSLDPELSRPFNNKSDFLIDEFKIWSAPITDFFH